MEWRPEDWTDKYQSCVDNKNYFSEQDRMTLVSQARVYEEGADNMLEALKHQVGTAYIKEDKGIATIEVPTMGTRKGWLVFIPDEGDSNGSERG